MYTEGLLHPYRVHSTPTVSPPPLRPPPPLPWLFRVEVRGCVDLQSFYHPHHIFLASFPGSWQPLLQSDRPDIGVIYLSWSSHHLFSDTFGHPKSITSVTSLPYTVQSGPSTLFTDSHGVTCPASIDNSSYLFCCHCDCQPQLW
eukprot:439583-Hanusia_phi.AAC.1